MNLRHCQAVLGGPKFEGPRQQPLQPFCRFERPHY